MTREHLADVLDLRAVREILVALLGAGKYVMPEVIEAPEGTEINEEELQEGLRPCPRASGLWTGPPTPKPSKTV